MHDAVQLELLGIPATVIITEPFTGLTASFAETLGFAGYAPVVLPHPVATRSGDALAELATAAAPEVARRLTEPAPIHRRDVEPTGQTGGHE